MLLKTIRLLLNGSGTDDAGTKLPVEGGRDDGTEGDTGEATPQMDPKTARRHVEEHLREQIQTTATTVQMRGDHSACKEATDLYRALTHALEGRDEALEPVFDIDGMSGWRYRQLINTLVAATDNARYLEVGSWAGSTACSAMYRNKARVTCIDNWSELGGPRDKFQENVAAIKNPNVDFRLIEADFRQVPYADIGTYNIYLFDGPHREIDQLDGIRMAMPALDRRFVLIVDDWNSGRVRRATYQAIASENLKLVYSVEVRTSQVDELAAHVGKFSEWHNGYFMGVCEKV